MWQVKLFDLSTLQVLSLFQLENLARPRGSMLPFLCLASPTLSSSPPSTSRHSCIHPAVCWGQGAVSWRVKLQHPLVELLFPLSFSSAADITGLRLEFSALHHTFTCPTFSWTISDKLAPLGSASGSTATTDSDYQDPSAWPAMISCSNHWKL